MPRIITIELHVLTISIFEFLMTLPYYVTSFCSHAPKRLLTILKLKRIVNLLVEMCKEAVKIF